MITGYPTTANEYSIPEVLLVVVVIVFVFLLYPIGGLILQQGYYGLHTNRPAQNFHLYDTGNNPVSLSNYNGKFVYLMFGYLRCTEICHTQVATLHALSSALPGKDIEFLYLAMDPDRDKPSDLEAYFDRRSDNFTSLHARESADMHSVARAYNAGFRFLGNPETGSYSVEHPARVFLIDREGNLRLMYQGASLDINKLAEDFHQLNPIVKVDS